MSFLRRSMSNIGKARKGQRGFTIIEFIIVIALMAILTGVLVPMFFTSSDGAREAKRNAGAEAIATALRMYMNDKGPFSTYPVVDADGAVTTNGTVIGINDLVKRGLLPNIDATELKFYGIYYGTEAVGATATVDATTRVAGNLNGIHWGTGTGGIFADVAKSKVKTGQDVYISVIIFKEDNNGAPTTTVANSISVLGIDS